MAKESEFASALKKGLGRAMVLLRNDPHNPVLRTELMHACKTNLIYDKQCEASRAPYLCNLIREIGESRRFWDALLQGFVEPGGMDNAADRIQMFQILCSLAAENHELDRNVLPPLLLSVDYETVASGSMGALVRLEGLTGLIFCFRSFSHELGQTVWPFKSVLSEYIELHGKVIAQACLQQARESDPEFDRLMHVVEIPEQSERKVEGALDRATVRQLLATGQAVHHAWIRDASAEDLVWVADDLLASSDDKLTVRYLRLFRQREFPKPPAVLILLARSQNEGVAHAAVQALSRIHHPDVRNLALEFLSSAARAADGVLLLVKNWQPGDIVAIEEQFSKLGECDYEFHNFGCKLLDVFEAAPVPVAESLGSLLKIYEDGPCAVCRLEVVEMLVASGSDPAWMAAECLYDSDATVAALFEKP